MCGVRGSGGVQQWGCGALLALCEEECSASQAAVTAAGGIEGVLAALARCVCARAFVCVRVCVGMLCFGECVCGCVCVRERERERER